MFFLSSLPTSLPFPFYSLFFFNDTATTEIYTLSLHDALPILHCATALALLWFFRADWVRIIRGFFSSIRDRSEEHTSELQSHLNLVCRLLLEKKNGQVRWRTVGTSTSARGQR